MHHQVYLARAHLFQPVRQQGAGQTIYLLTFEEKMEDFTFEEKMEDYIYFCYKGVNYSGYYDDYEICNIEDINYLGVQLSFIYYFMFLFGLVGNVLVLVIIHRFERLTTVTNIFLLNLVVSSLIFISRLPFKAVYMQLSNWIFGNVMCKIVGSVYYLGFYSSGLFLALLTFDRHLAVVYSLGAPRLINQRCALLCCAVVWLVSSLACIPWMILYEAFHDTLDNTTFCYIYPDYFTYINLRYPAFFRQLFIFLLFPLVVIVYCYIRIAITVITSKSVTKFKTVRLIFVIVLLFFISWITYNVVVLLDDNEPMSCEGIYRRIYVEQITNIYFCISPIFFTFVGEKFQNYFRQMVVKRFPGLKKYISVDQAMPTESTQNELSSVMAHSL
ncbi:C-C chemokine receptor type 8-like [Scomber japonicus]|uniref:C-C chemokine receptor type 8-like n=1 Tax=Scomber japonicus TaxID=13676 RepID=UPI002304E98B|nr:C-C chemokine receptor type 8-like [Scomber japonicus]